MALIDILNALGRTRRLRPAGLLAHRAASSLRFSTLVGAAGRRMVTASAGAPAVLLTCGDMEAGLKDPDLLYEAMCFSVEEMGLDTFCLMADMSLEAEACGCELRFKERDLPMVVSHPLEARDDLAGLNPPDPHYTGRMPVFIETMRRVAQNYTMFRAAVVTGPFTLATHLRGTRIYTDTITSPESAGAVIEFASQVTLSYAWALVEAGADFIVLAEPSASLLSPRAYEAFAGPPVENLVSALEKPCVLHICGKTTHLVEMMWQSGATAISVDDVDLGAVALEAPGHVVVVGNISPTVLLTGSPEQIKVQTRRMLDTVRNRRAYLAHPGCDLAPETPLENVKAFVESAKAYA